MSNNPEPLDAVTARHLMIDYRNALGVTGGSEIERRIASNTRLGLSRKTIENWLNNSDRVPSRQTLSIISRFVRSEHFRSVVPKAHYHLDADARLLLTGAALAEIYGPKGVDSSTLIDGLLPLEGYWVQSWLCAEVVAVNFIKITSVADQPFSKIVILPFENFAPKASGIIYPCEELGVAFAGKVWLRESENQQEHLRMDVDENNPSQLAFSFARAGRVAPHVDHYSRCEEALIPEDIRAMCNELSIDVLSAPQQSSGRHRSRLFRVRA